MADYTVAPGATLEYTKQVGGVTGAAASLRIRIYDGPTDVTAYGPSGTGIVESVVTPTVYSAILTAPTTGGDYLISLTHLTLGLIGTDTLSVTSSPTGALLGGGRSTMSSLITRVRRLSGDLSGASQVFSDAEVQEMLDQTRTDVRYLLLAEDMTVTPASLAQYLAYYDPRYGGGWEDDVVLTSGTYAVLTPSVSDALVGKWTFAASTLPPVFLSGKVYDVYEAAGDLLDQWAARAATCFDFETDGQKYARSQKTRQLREAASEIRIRARPRVVRMTRRDAAC